MTDYDLVPSAAPRRRRPPGRPSQLLRNLVAIATDPKKYPPGEDVRIARYPSAETARVLAYNLRTGKRAAAGRPAGTWVFTHGPDEDRFGVWANFTPPTA